jgi:hypothetical protein
MQVLQSLGSKSCSDTEFGGRHPGRRRGGVAGRREMTRSHAKQMVAIREVKRAALKASGRRGDLYGWTGTRLGGRPGTEMGDRGKPWSPRDRRLLKLR